MNPAKLFNIAKNDSMMKSITRSYDVSPPTEIQKALRKSILHEMFRVIQENLHVNSVDLVYVLKSSFTQDLEKWLKGEWINREIKVSFNRRSFLETEIVGLIKLLTINGFFSYYSAREAAQTLFKEVPGTSNYFYGRNGLAERAYVTSNSSARNIISSGFKYLLTYGRSLNGLNRERVQVPLQPVHESWFFADTINSKILYSVEVNEGEQENNYDVALIVRYSKGQKSCNVMNRLIIDQIAAAFSYMPHVSKEYFGMSQGPKIGVDYVCAKFTIDLSSSVKTSPAELVKEVAVSSSGLSPSEVIEFASHKVLAGDDQEPEQNAIVPMAINDDIVKAYLEKRVVELSDELGILINQRDTISEQIANKSDQQNKLRAILEVL